MFGSGWSVVGGSEEMITGLEWQWMVVDSLG